MSFSSWGVFRAEVPWPQGDDPAYQLNASRQENDEAKSHGDHV
jgi:hypothetical protein